MIEIYERYRGRNYCVVKPGLYFPSIFVWWLTFLSSNASHRKQLIKKKNNNPNDVLWKLYEMANKSSIYVICHVFGRFNYPKISVCAYKRVIGIDIFVFGCGGAIERMLLFCLKKACYARRFFFAHPWTCSELNAI